MHAPPVCDMHEVLAAPSFGQRLSDDVTPDRHQPRPELPGMPGTPVGDDHVMVWNAILGPLQGPQMLGHGPPTAAPARLERRPVPPRSLQSPIAGHADSRPVRQRDQQHPTPIRVKGLLPRPRRRVGNSEVPSQTAVGAGAAVTLTDLITGELRFQPPHPRYRTPSACCYDRSGCAAVGPPNAAGLPNAPHRASTDPNMVSHSAHRPPLTIRGRDLHHLRHAVSISISDRFGAAATSRIPKPVHPGLPEFPAPRAHRAWRDPECRTNFGK